MTIEEIRAAAREASRARMIARAAQDEEELPRAQARVRSDGAGPSRAPAVLVPEPLPHVPMDIPEIPPVPVPSPVPNPAPVEETPPLSPGTVLGHPFGSPGPALHAPPAPPVLMGTDINVTLLPDYYMAMGGLSESRRVRTELMDRITTPRSESSALPAGVFSSLERIESTSRIAAAGHLEGRVEPAVLAAILALITSVVEQVKNVIRGRIP